MNNEVRYDTGAMKSIASQMESEIETFRTQTIEPFFDAMASEIGLDPSHQTWNGEQAERFIKENINPKRQEFEVACKSIISFANNLSAQAKSWDDFENS